MKRYCRYISILNLQWKYCFKELILIIAGMAAAQLLLLYRTIEKTVSQFVPGAVLTELDEALGAKNLQGIRFEDLMDKSYWAIIFGAALMLVVGLIYAAPIRQSRGADSWSAWRRLPVARAGLIAAVTFQGMCCILMLWAAQLGTVFAGYRIYLDRIPEANRMYSALFLAFVRLDFLRGIFPITSPERMAGFWALMLVLCLAAVCSSWGVERRLRWGEVFPLFYAVFLSMAVLTASSDGIVIVGVLMLAFGMGWITFRLYRILKGQERTEDGFEKQDVDAD